MMKTAIVILISFQFMCPQTVLAGPFYDQAVAAVAAQRRALQSQTETLVLNDVLNLSLQITKEMLPLQNNLNSMADINHEIEALAAGFQKISDLKPSDFEKLKGKIHEYLERYAALNREYFALTFLPSTIALERKSFPSMFDRFISSYEYMCSSGRNDLKWDGGLPANLAPDDIKFSVYGEGATSRPGKLIAKQYNHDVPALDDVEIGAGGAFGVSSTVVLSRTVGEWLQGGVMQSVGAWGTAAAWSAGIFAAAVIAEYLYGISQYNKAMTDYYYGEKYKLENEVSAQDISREYTKSCSNLVVVFKQAQSKLHAALLEDPETVQKNTGDLKSRQIHLNDEIQQLSRLTSEKLDAENKNSDKVAVDKLKSSETKLFQKVSAEALLLAADAITKFIAVDVPKLALQFNPSFFYKVEVARENALSRLAELLDIGEAAQEVKLSNEVAAQSNYLRFQNEFMELLGKSIAAIFGRYPLSRVNDEYKKYETSFDAFYFNHSEIEEVVALKRAVDRLGQFLGGK